MSNKFLKKHQKVLGWLTTPRCAVFLFARFPTHSYRGPIATDLSIYCLLTACAEATMQLMHIGAASAKQLPDAILEHIRWQQGQLGRGWISAAHARILAPFPAIQLRLLRLIPAELLAKV